MTDSERKPPWYVSAFDRSYIERYRHRDDSEAARQIRFLAGAGHLPDECKVLDLCCGPGRHSVQIARRGGRAIGMDLSHDLLREARHAGESAEILLPLVRGDMRRLPFGAGRFDLVIQMFTAFGYFGEDAENQAVLAEVARVLSPGGRYILDLLNRTFAVRALVPESLDLREDGTQVRQLRRFDRGSGRIKKEVFETDSGGRRRRRFESVRVFDRDEITAWLRAARLEVLSIHGGFHEGAFDADQSKRLIVVSRRPR